MVVDHEGRVHVLMKSEDGRPVHFERDPESAKWSRHKTTKLGKLIVGSNDALYIVGEGELLRTSASHFGNLDTVASARRTYFDNSKMGIDRTRDDGWISVIGQKNKKVTVVDYWIGK